MLSNIVPPVYLCKQLPVGSFSDSSLVWRAVLDPSNNPVYEDIFPRECGTCDLLDVGRITAPAPTLQELMSSVPHCRVYKKKSGRFIACSGEHGEIRVCDTDATIAMIKLWFRLKGVNYE